MNDVSGPPSAATSSSTSQWRVGGQQHAHRRRMYRQRLGRCPPSLREQPAADLAERRRGRARRRRAAARRPAASPSSSANGVELVPRRFGQRPQLGEVAPQRSPTIVAVGSAAAAAASGSAAVPDRTTDGPGWRPRRCRSMPCPPSCSVNHTASVTVSRCGEATTTYRVASERSSPMTASARCAEALLHAGERLEEGDGVGQHVGADDLADARSSGWVADVDHPHARAAPAASAAGTAGGRGTGPARRAPPGSRGRCGSVACPRRRGRSARRRGAGAASRPPCTPACR